MSNKLRFILEPLPHPYAQSADAEFEAWGRLTIYVLTDMSRTLLLRTQWNLDALAEWFSQHHSALCQRRQEIEQQRSLVGESLAQRNWRLRQRFDHLGAEITDKQVQEMEQWELALSASSGYTLNAMLPGAGIPPIVLGCHDGQGEISFEPQSANHVYESTNEFVVASGRWAYAFDMADFLARLRSALILFLRVWLQEPHSAPARSRTEQLLSRLQALPTLLPTCCQ